MKKALYIFSFIAIVIFVILCALVYTPELSPTFDIINHHVKTPYFSITLPEKMDKGERGDDDSAMFYRFLSPPYTDDAPQQMVIKVYREDSVSKEHILRHELGNVTSSFISSPSAQEVQALRQVFSQAPQRFTMNGATYSMMGITLRNTQFVFLLSTQYEKVYVFELVSRDYDPAVREANMKALASSFNNLHYISTISDDTKISLYLAFWACLICIVLLFLLVRFIPKWKKFVSEMDAALDVKDDPLLSKYRDDPESPLSGRKKINLAAYSLLVGSALAVIGGVVFRLNPSLLTLPVVNLIYPFTMTHWILLGLIFGFPVVLLRSVYTMPFLLAAAFSIEISCLIIGILGPYLRWFNQSPNLAILSLSTGLFVPLDQAFDSLVTDYLRGTYVGKIFELKTPIKIVKYPPIPIKTNHIGHVILRNLKVWVIGEDLTMPVGSRIKITGIDKKFKIFTIEKV